MVKNWVNKTPNNFRFTAAFPKIITHDKHLVDVDKEVDFLYVRFIGDRTIDKRSLEQFRRIEFHK